MGRMTKASYERKENILLARLEIVNKTRSKIREKWQRAKTDTAFIETEGVAFVSREKTPYKGG